MGGRKEREKRTLNHEEESGKASSSQQKAMWEARMFKLELLKEIQQRINETEKQLWEEVDRDRLHEECRKVEDWILDPNHNVGKLSLYERTVALLWVMKNLIEQPAWDRKEENSVEVQPD